MDRGRTGKNEAAMGCWPPVRLQLLIVTSPRSVDRYLSPLLRCLRKAIVPDVTRQDTGPWRLLYHFHKAYPSNPIRNCSASDGRQLSVCDVWCICWFEHVSNRLAWIPVVAERSFYCTRSVGRDSAFDFTIHDVFNPPNHPTQHGRQPDFADQAECRRPL